MKQSIAAGPLTPLLLVAAFACGVRVEAADDTARFYGTWQTTVQVNGQALTLVSLHDAAGYHNHFHGPTGNTPAGEGTFSAADGRYSAQAPQPNDAGVYHFTSDDTVVCTNAAGQTAVWKRTQAPAAPGSFGGRTGGNDAAAGGSAGGGAPGAPAYDPSLPPETNAAIAAFNRKDYPAAWQSFMAGAHKGDAEAEAGVGAMLFKHLNPPGTGYYAQCEKWLLASANQGNAKGMDFLAQYYYAVGVTTAGGINPGVNNAPVPPALRAQAEAKFTLARQWFERAAAKGDVYAMGNLAGMLDAGIGGPRDPARAGQLRAQVKAGPDKRFADKVLASPGDSALAGAWQAGHYADAVKLATDLANKGDVRAQALLARAYYVGQGVARDDHAAFGWAQKAAAADDPDGLYLLGQCYANSRGVARNLTKADGLFEQAIDRGSIEARSARSGIDWAVGRVKSPVDGGITFCARGTSDTLGGCVGDGGKNLDPVTGKALY
ncbi:MAG TPA: tetratricopeptide repeat protein [Steroidobacteraceae bacterium]|nr:tetratricopeptide repeat protein [Steroidobacteraceae bacterium]